LYVVRLYSGLALWYCFKSALSTPITKNCSNSLGWALTGFLSDFCSSY